MLRRTKISLWVIFIVLLVFVFIYSNYRLYQPTVSQDSHLPLSDDVHVAHRPIPKGVKIIRILSLNGGGIRGILTAHVLQYLEKVTGKPISKLFDFVTCTSTGCLIAAQLLTPDANGNPRFTAAEVLKNYDRQARAIFRNPLSHKIISLGGFLGPEYSNRGKEQILKRHLGSILFAQLLLPTVVTAYSLKERAPRLFKSYSEEARHYYLWAVLNAATSAPIFFPAMVLRSIRDKYPEDIIIDGGIYAPNPSLTGLAQAFVRYPKSDYLLVSIGTGHHIPSVSSKQATHWGILGWWRSLLLMLFNAQSIDANRVLSNIDESDVLGRRLDYYYFSVAIATDSEFIDNISSENIKRLNAYGEKLVEENRFQLDQLAKRLSNE
ncbi:patatin-like phospholipase family protein [Coxiella burnetii]|uniref:patatin-like phospholipase family protein n=1 Tax=Coxiella burnetii TaxID=777 RepID=UPI00051F1AB1|nr:patatin-like phospholipase family protein [Coxiella burnetii]AIT63029.1 Patatin-like protein [Coxiella burnetii str. Namibia]